MASRSRLGFPEDAEPVGIPGTLCALIFGNIEVGVRPIEGRLDLTQIVLTTADGTVDTIHWPHRSRKPARERSQIDALK
jgi:hypothetical protein